jgi:hypothetical protein
MFRSLGGPRDDHVLSDFSLSAACSFKALRLTEGVPACYASTDRGSLSASLRCDLGRRSAFGRQNETSRLIVGQGFAVLHVGQRFRHVVGVDGGNERGKLA